MKRGFTLIELLVVIAIIGILAGIVLAALSSSRQAANVAKARAEMKEIQKAAEIVFTEYGYYPNDSHGSITCPKDIIIDQASGRTWGDFISICNDPWGHPYEWDNACLNGATRKPHAPYDPSCASFSDQSQGVFGVTMVGPDGINDGCTGDDVCYGADGHTIYGWGSSGDNSGGSGPMCTNDISDCSALSAGQCSSRQGCTLNGSACTGTYSTSCTGLGDQTSCQAQTGCGWTVGGSCGGNYACSQWSGTNSATCTTGHSCTWSSAQGGKCNGGSQSCSAFAQSSCTPSGCSWSATASCTGSYNSSCAAYNGSQTSCQAQTGCSWSAASCSGTATSCTGFNDESSCSAQAGCSWQ